MKKKRFSIEKSDLAAYPTCDLHGMVHFVHTFGELVAQANISAWYEPLADLEADIADDLFAISRVVQRVEKRLAGELARRTQVEKPVAVFA